MSEQTNLLLDDEMYLEQASTGKRFANYIIDVLFFYAFMFGLAITFQILSPGSLDFLDNNSTAFNLLDRLISLIIYGVLLGIIEGASKGKTLGKLITGTRAVNEDGSSISFTTGFFRGLCRAIPFNAFSALGTPSYPWHDKWTNTYVIDVKASTLPV